LKQNLESAHSDFTTGLLTLLQACSKWDVTADELIRYIREEHANESKTKRDSSGGD